MRKTGPMAKFGKFKHFDVYDDFCDPPEPDWEKEGYMREGRSLEAGPATGTQLAKELDDALTALFSGMGELAEVREAWITVEKSTRGKPKLGFFLQVDCSRKMTREERAELKEHEKREADDSFRNHKNSLERALAAHPELRQMVVDGDL